MKLIKMMVALSCVLYLGSCIKEDMSDCPRENVFLTFVYTGNTVGANADHTWFDKMIDKVSLYVYNADTGDYLPEVTQQLDKAALTATDPAGTKLLLPEGRYTIVCWGNAFDATQIVPAVSIDGGTVSHPSYGTPAELPTQDHNYYGMTTVTVPQSGEVSGEVRFRGAHINMEVVVKGFTGEQNTAEYPRIEIANAMPQYVMSSMAAAAGYTQTYVPQVGWSATEGGNLSTFQLFHFKDKNQLQLTVTNQAQNQVFYTVGLENAMSAGGITVEDAGGNVMNEASVRIVLDFTNYWNDLSVKISVEGWSSENPVPEL